MNNSDFLKSQVNLSSAEKMYRQHLISVSNYHKKNKDKVREKQKRYIEKLRSEPSRYEAYLEKRRNYERERKIRKLAL